MPDGSGRIGCHIWRNLFAQERMNVWRVYNGFLIVKGEGVYTDWEGREWPLSPGCFGQHLPGKYHRVQRDHVEEWRECSITLDRSHFDAAVLLGIIDPDRPVARPGLDLALLNRFRRTHDRLEAASYKDLGREMLGLLQLLQHIRELSERRSFGPLDEIVEEAKALLSERFDETIDLPGLIAQFPVSYFHFRRVFREKTGMAPGQFRLVRKMEMASMLLAEGGMTISGVSEHVGYNDRFAFSKQFRKTTGLSPGAYQRSVTRLSNAETPVAT